MFLYVIFLHWIADFVLQTHWMASNKSKDNRALAAHVGVYAVTMTLGLAWVVYGPRAILFFLITFATHFGTDYVTSRISSRLFGKDWHNFFVVVGFDQFIHYATLYATLVALHVL